MTLASPLSNSLPASILASTLISLLPSQPAFTQTLWLPFPFDSKGTSLPSDSFFSSPEADGRLRLLRVAYSCRVITPCLSIQLVARLVMLKNNFRNFFCCYLCLAHHQMLLNADFCGSYFLNITKNRKIAKTHT